MVWNGTWAATQAPGADDVATSGGGLTNFTVSRKHFGYSAATSIISGAISASTTSASSAPAPTAAASTAVSTVEQPDPWKGFRRMQVGVYGAHDWNDDRLRLYHLLDVYGALTFRNFWTLYGETGREFQAFDDLDTRGGPPILVPGRQFAYLSVGSDSRKSWRLNVNLNRRSDEVDGWSNQIGPSLSFQPSTRLQASISASYTAARDIAQWITNTDVNGDGATDHVYGTLRRNVVDVTMRGTLALNRDMTLQVFLQPFVASGDYTNIRRLARPLSFDFDPAVIADDPDFNSKSMRSNVVLRWEYVRGSTLYAVWNMSSSDESRPGTFSPLRDLRDAFRGDGPNLFMVKISYWMSR